MSVMITSVRRVSVSSIIRWSASQNFAIKLFVWGFRVSEDVMRVGSEGDEVQKRELQRQ